MSRGAMLGCQYVDIFRRGRGCGEGIACGERVGAVTLADLVDQRIDSPLKSLFICYGVNKGILLFFGERTIVLQWAGGIWTGPGQ